MHSGEGVGGGFTREQLQWWAGRIRGLGHSGRDCHVYFNNDRGGHAPQDARTLLDILKPGAETKHKRPPRE
jgi:uncharacterized protein YecE (DUF72 family)